ncbi:glycosyltransferase family protein [Phaeocystidibacter marisrubri]|uniref:Glycosyltransferase n=1 Tax=Phaeocystidibacter marisrubri TaxID=1577780 RepID=A0A6L3ZFG3_9FLAO|nr:hypothetical protein [Phaeocystidibacter marisrubri]KAB2816154.1 hypothetical protein F8C82_10730 [Phaeocystidibacter marisrubri]GGH67604.1 hypothetical protein GCM10011318_06750 [Phaeocystidibacter marisrubri]
MKVSGFTFVRNADKLFIPVKESILSVLPLCDEFVIALGNNDEDDRTEEFIHSIGSDKIKIVRTIWDSSKYLKNTEYARQTDIAKEHCTGDWLFYIQSDEAVHEKDHAEIQSALEKYVDDETVDGFVFNYNHFWGDFNHVHRSHGWYRQEMRIIRNRPDIHSYKDAQSFRIYDSFREGDYREYLRTEGTHKLNAVALNADIYHYGYARPPYIMAGKRKQTHVTFRGTDESVKEAEAMKPDYDYGPLDRIPVFKGTHPAVMKDWIARFDWADQLQYSGKPDPERKPHKHEKLKYRMISWVENNLRGGKAMFAFRNFEIINPK